MKILGGILLVAILGLGYLYFFPDNSLPDSFSAPRGSKIKVPPHFFVTNIQEELLGFGMPLFSEKAVLFDGWGEVEIFKKEELIEFSLRDFETKVGYTNISYWNGNLPEWSETAPIVGNTLYWLSGTSNQVSSGKVFSVESDVEKALPVILEGGVDLKSLGSPVFDSYGKVYGIITGADTSAGQIFMTRIDRILEYYEGGKGQ